MTVDRMSAQDLLEAAEEAVLEARTRAKVQRGLADAADAEADEHEDEARILRRMIERFGGVSTPPPNGHPDEVPPHVSLRRLPRVEAVTEIFWRQYRNGRTRLSPGDIEELLRQEGRTDKRQAVRNALTEMRKTNVIENHGRGAWELTAAYVAAQGEADD